MSTSIEKIRAQKLASYHKSHARKKALIAEKTEFNFLQSYPYWEEDKFLIKGEYRIVLEGYYALGTDKLSLQQLAFELGISKQAVQERRDRGLKRLDYLAQERESGPKKIKLLEEEKDDLNLRQLASEIRN